MGYPSPLLPILHLELLSNCMRGSRKSGTGSGFMILEYNFNFLHSSEEFMLHLKKQKKRFSPSTYTERSRSGGQSVLITSREGGA